MVTHSTFSTHTTADNTYNTLPAPTTAHNTTSNTTPLEPSLESENLLLQLAATAEQSSDHPLSRAVLQAAKERHLVLHPLREDATVYFIGQCCVCMCSLLDWSVFRLCIGSLLYCGTYVNDHEKSCWCLVFDGLYLDIAQNSTNLLAVFFFNDVFSRLSCLPANWQFPYNIM